MDIINNTESSTSSDGELNLSEIKYDGDPQQKVSSDTSFHMNYLANPDKVKPEGRIELAAVPEGSTSKVSDSESSSSSSSSDSKSESSRSNSKSPSIPTIPTMPNSFSNLPKPVNYSSPPVMINEKETKLKKIDMLRKLSELKAKGYDLSKEYSFHSSLEEMEYEYDLLKSYVDKNNSVKMYKNLLINGVALVEFFNEKYDPFDFHLQGWSEHMSVEVDSYDDVMEELYEKYRGSGKNMPPEIKLLFLIAASGAAFHYSKSTLGKVVGLDKPGMVANMMNKSKEESRFMTQQEIHIQNLKEKERLSRQPMQSPSQMRAGPLRPENMGNNFSYNSNMMSSNPRMDQPKIEIPNNVNSILSKLKSNKDNNDRVLSEATISDSLNSSERKRRGRKPKSTIHIDT